ncbi:MAG: GNAT family N-acetyltransferase [Myxococcales bacterium]|nr:GNAT family N-acetyltransferase [Myxococcales bacterium]
MDEIRLVRGAEASHLDEMARLAGSTQERPERHTPYLSTTVAGIRSELAETNGWSERTVRALDARTGELVGWVLPDIDPELGRVWWVGPVVAQDHDWGAVAAQLHGAVALPSDVTQQEMCGDERFELLGDFARERGFDACRASVALNCETAPAEVVGPVVRPLRPADHVAVTTLHDDLFPGTHTPGRALVASIDPQKLRWVIGEPVAGYVAAEVQSDGLGYIDFLGVDPEQRRQGLGRALVVAATRELFARGVPHTHLTVWRDNVTAIALYRSLGYVAERTFVPYRRGFR